MIPECLHYGLLYNNYWPEGHAEEEDLLDLVLVAVLMLCFATPDEKQTG